MKRLIVLAAAFAMLLGAGAAYAFPFDGYVTCEGNGEPQEQGREGAQEPAAHPAGISPG